MERRARVDVHLQADRSLLAGALQRDATAQSRSTTYSRLLAVC
jgi:hypothetical protein